MRNLSRPTDLHTKQYLMLGVVVVVGVAWLAIGASGGDGGASSTATTTSSVVVSGTVAPPAIGVTTTTIVDLVGDEEVPDDCTIPAKTLRSGDSGTAVVCVQKALIKTKWLKGKPSGTFDGKTHQAIVDMQTEKALFVDGEVGRETAIVLGIWPEERLNVVRTPPPAPGAKDSMGFVLSSVASTGADAPPLPANSGTGRRIVYQRSGQRVWAVDKDGAIIRSWLVSGSRYDNEVAGTHKVFSKSEITTAWNGKAFLKKMVRWMKTNIGAIGFHQIPVHRDDGTVYQTEEELGTRLSGGCQRQAKEDADFMWKFATIGTPVVVL